MTSRPKLVPLIVRQKAILRLRSFDLVGVTSCLLALYDALDVALGWAPQDTRWSRNKRVLDRKGRAISISQVLLLHARMGWAPLAYFRPILQVAFVWLHNESAVHWYALNTSERAQVARALHNAQH